jgi:hypothetical protein
MEAAMYTASSRAFSTSRLLLFVAVPAVTLLTACPPNANNRVAVNPNDNTVPTPVVIKGHMTGAAGDSTAGAAGTGTPTLIVLNSTAGQLEITVTASDAESGIKKLEIFSNDRLCNFSQETWGGGNLATKFRNTINNAPDASGTLPLKTVALANIQTTTERGSKDKITWQIFGAATNGAGKVVNIGPLFYTAVSTNVPADRRNDGCP